MNTNFIGIIKRDQNKRAHALYMLFTFSECDYPLHLTGVQAPS